MSNGMHIGSIYYEVEADTSKLVNSTANVDGSLDALTRSMGKTDAAAHRLGGGFNRISAEAKRFGRETDSASASLSGFTRVIGGLLTLRFAGELIGMAENYNEMAERVRMATSSQEEFEMVQQRLLQTANGTYRAMSEAQEVYIRTADSLRSMGYSTEQALDITDSLSYSFVTNAASADRANSAIAAFSKSINKGKVDVEAWESIIAAVPSIINDIAAASGKAAAEIRELGSSGKLSLQMLTEGARKSLDATKKAADEMVTTVRDAVTRLRNNLSAYLAEANQATGSTAALSKGIVLLAENLETVASSLIAIGAGALAGYVTSTFLSAYANAKAVIEERNKAVQTLNSAKAVEAATLAELKRARALSIASAMVQGAAAKELEYQAAVRATAAAQSRVSALGFNLVRMLGGPVGIISLIGTAAASWYLFRDRSEQAARAQAELNRSTKTGVERLKELNDERDRLRNGGELISGEEEKHIAEASAAVDRYTKALEILIQTRNNYLKSGQPEQAYSINPEIDRLNDLIAGAQREINRTQGAGRDQKVFESNADAKRLVQELRDQIALAKLEGEARIRLQALQKIGPDVSDPTKKEYADLSVELARIIDAQEKLKEASRQRAAAEERDAELIRELTDAVAEAALAGEDLAAAKAKAKLSAFAGPDQVTQVEELARANYRAAEGARMLREQTELLVGLEGRRRQYQRDLDSYGMGSSVRELNSELAKVEDYYQDIINQRRASAQGLSDEELEAVRGAMNRELEMVREHHEAKKRIEQDWQLGAVNAVQDYVDQASNLYAQVGNAVTNTFGSMEDALVGFVRNGKINFRELADSIIADLIRIQARQMLTSIFSAVGGAFGGAATAGGGYGSTGLLNTQGSATVLGQSVTLPLAGGRANGGPVAAGKMYRINERGDPEILNANGKQYLMMNQSRGHVTPMDSAAPGSAGGGTVVQVINSTSQPARQERGRAPDGREMIRVFIGEAAQDVAENGPLGQAIARVHGLQRKPR